MKTAGTLFVALALASVAWSAPEEGLVYEPATGNYVLTYDCGEDGGLQQTTLVPANKIAPAVESFFEVASGGVVYRYDLMLGPSSRQPLMMFALDPVRQVWNIVAPPSQDLLSNPTADKLRKYQDAVIASSPSGWEVFHDTRRSGETRVGWSRDLAAPDFSPGSRQQGFAFASRHLPGLVAAHFEGDNGGTWAFPCETPGEDTNAGLAVASLSRNNHVPRFVAAPVIRVPHPFDPVAVLTSLRSHVLQIEQWGLADASFSAQIRGYLSDAISKFEAGNVVGGTAALSKLRVALRAKYPSLDSETAIHAVPPRGLLQNPVDDMRKLITEYDRVLAARILDFDVGYVSERIAPVAVPMIPSEDCHSPADDTICAPTNDPDGTFMVRWGAKSCPKQQGDSSCELTKAKYRLERSQDSKFFLSSVAYEGPAREFQITGAAAGAHYFRVTVDYSYCVKGYGFGYTSDYCDEDQMHWQSATDTYAAGPNKTVVDAP